MNEEELRKLITTAIPNIKESVPNQTLVMPSYMLDFGYIETATLYGDGGCISTNQYVQIDLYYKDKTGYAIAKNKLKKALIANNIFSDLESFFDGTNKYYRATYQVIVAHDEKEREV